MNLILTEDQTVELENRFNWRIPLRATPADCRVTMVDAIIPLKGKTVMDVGTLDGHITASLVETGARVTTIDCRMSNLALGWARLFSYGFDPFKVEFCLGDIESMPPGSSWQVIFHSGTFYHVHNPVRHLSDLLPHFSEHLILETHTFRDDLKPGVIEEFGERFTGGWYAETGMPDPASSKNANDSFWLDHESMVRLFAVLKIKVVSTIYRDKPCDAGPRSCWILEKA